MSVITIFSGKYCKKNSIIDAIIDKTGYTHITDEILLKEANKISGMDIEKVQNALKSKISIFNNFTHEKERAICYLKMATAKALNSDNIIIDGYTAMLVPNTIRHALKVCLIADTKYRVARAVEEKEISKKEALELIHKEDENQSEWVRNALNQKDPWEPSLYDIVIPVDKFDEKEVISMIVSNLQSDAIKPTEWSQKAVNDFILSSEAEVVLAKEGHVANVSVRDSRALITINKNVILLNRLEEELKSIVGQVPGITSVATQIGKKFYKADTYRKYDFKLPSKILLVDDEREFVKTLSERLLLRDMGAAVVHDGESALDLLKEDEPDIMVLDLNMPGIDGIGVLKEVKKTNPQIEVIILTGHGSDEDKKICMELGAFAYLQKPVDIELLSQYLKEANKKLKR